MIEKTKNIIIDLDYTAIIKWWWYPKFDHLIIKAQPPKGIFDRFFGSIFSTEPSISTDKTVQVSSDGIVTASWPVVINENAPLEDQVKQILNIPDKDYNDKLLNGKIRKYIWDIEKWFIAAMSTYKSHIAPSYREVKPSYFNLSWIYGKTYYTNNYPSYIDFLWTRDMLGFYSKRDMSRYIYPSDDWAIQTELKRRATQLKAEINDMVAKWITMDSDVQVEYEDVESIRQKLTTKEERYFQAGYYINLYNHDQAKLNEDSKKLEQKAAGVWLGIKNATQRMDEGMTSISPIAIDDLGIYRSAVTTSLAGSFPFISSDLISSTGILYGVNLHTWWLVIHDRFDGKSPNANSVVLATSGAGKSFTVKLEILRYLLHGIDVIVIDPENEYMPLTKKVWWTYINIAINSNQFVNPFDLPPEIEDVEYGPWDLLRSQILSLIGLISTLIWGTTPEEEALLDKALQSTYQLKWFTFDTNSYTGKQPPIMQDLLSIMEWMDGWAPMAMKLSKYVTGTFAKLFNNYTNVDLSNGLTVFSIRDLEDSLKTPAMYNILNFIRAKVRSHKVKRLLVVDEARIMLQNPISSNFLFGIVKRARKYGLWVTTISQDVEDFVKSEYGKPIVTNSSLQILLRQSTASIKNLEQIFWLSDAEKQKLVSSNIWDGIIFAGSQHIAVHILASDFEKEFIETNVE
jgi:conjugal transfer ATP-binding protein TraC